MSSFAKHLCCFFIFVFLFCFTLEATENKRIVKVGAFSYPPGIFLDTDGKVKGLYPDWFFKIASDNQWEIQYVFGTWAEGLERIKKGDVDVLTSVAFTPERASFMDFPEEAALTVWGEAYVHHDSKIHSLFDLRSKKIAVMKNDFNGQGFKNLMSSFNLPCTYIEVASFDEVFQLIDSNHVDAGIINNTVASAKMNLYQVRPTGIVFNPFQIYFTVAKGKNTELLKAINNQLQEWKQNQDSPYYQGIRFWLRRSIDVKPVFPPYTTEAILFIFTLSAGLVIFSFLLKRKVTRATSSLLANQQMLHSILNTIPQAVFWKNADNVFLGCNKAFAKDVSLNTVEEVIGKTENDLIWGQERGDLYCQQSQEVLSTKKPLMHNEEKYLKKNKTIGWTDYSLLPLLDGKKNATAVLGVFEDITLRKTAEIEIQAREERLRNLIENIPGVVFSTEEKSPWQAYMMSPAVLYFIGYNQSDFFGENPRTWASLVHPEDLHMISTKIDLKIAQNQQYEVEYRIIKKNDEICWFFERGRAVYNEFKHPTRIDRILFDINEKKLAEQEIIKAKEDAEMANKAKSIFLASMSHELRTPLNIILGYTQEIIETCADCHKITRPDFLKTLLKNEETLLDTINSILDFSVIESNQLNLNISSFNLNELIHDVFSLFQKPTKDKVVTLTLNSSIKAEQIVWGDSFRLKQVFINLLANATKFTEKGSIEITACFEKANLQFCVKDTGIGIPPNSQKNIFNPFFQADDSISRRFGGTGLGLSICKNLITLMKGNISFTSVPDQGTTFFVTIPLSLTPPHFESTANAQIKYPRRTSNEVPRLLVVDDSIENAELLSLFLKNFDLKIDLVESAQHCFEQIKEKEYDLIFMDIQMPVIDGYQATQTIRRYEADHHLKANIIIACTAHAFLEDIERARAAGCDEHLAKPIKKEKLLNLIQSFSLPLIKKPVPSA